MTKARTIGIAALLLGLCFGLQVMSARLKAPTYDEQGYIARGYAYVALGDLHVRIGTPVGLNALNALPLLALPGVRLPVDSPSWSGTDFHPIGERFLWHVNANADQILFLARLPTMYLTLLLAAFVFRWAREMFSPRSPAAWGGLLSLALCALDPNVIAHGRLATTDLGSAALMFIATYWAWRFLRVPAWRHLALTGVFVGLAQTTKFSALTHVPILGLIFLVRAFAPLPFALSLPWYSPLEQRTSPQRWWNKLSWLALSGVLIGVVAFLALWAVYGFQVGPIPDLTTWPVPAPAHLEQLLDVSGRLVGEEERLPTGFLLGELYSGGRWAYFPVAFLVKTPIPTMIFVGGAVLLILWRSVSAWVRPAVSARSERTLSARSGSTLSARAGSRAAVGGHPGRQRGSGDPLGAEADPLGSQASARAGSRAAVGGHPGRQRGSGDPLGAGVDSRQANARPRRPRTGVRPAGIRPAGIGPVGWALWLPPVVYFLLSLRSNLNLGYRYLLPMLPFLFVIAGRTGEWIASAIAGPRSRWCRALLGVATVALLAWLAWGTLSIYPHYLAFFNELAGGPENGWRILVDTNLDWGQDLKGLKRWMDEQGVERIKLGYLGEAYPAYYGIQFDPLPSWPDRWQHPLYHDLYPLDPAPGLYAISANLIQGRNLADPRTYAWFRERAPIDKVGYSIFIYDVPAHGEGPVALGLSGVDLADVRAEDYARLGTNDVRVLWFDARRALVAPDDESTATWLLIADETPLHPMLRAFLPDEGQAGAPCLPATTRSGRSFCMWTDDPRQRMMAHVETLAPDAPVWHLTAGRFMPGDPADHGQRLATPVRFGDSLELLAYEVEPDQARETTLRARETTLHAGETLTVVTYWRVREPVNGPLKLFVHLLDAESATLGGEDRLDVWTDNWQAGDMFAQVQEVPLDAGAAPGRAQVEIGWYDPESMQRLPVLREGVVIADRVLLEPVEVE